MSNKIRLELTKKNIEKIIRIEKQPYLLKREIIISKIHFGMVNGYIFIDGSFTTETIYFNGKNRPDNDNPLYGCYKVYFDDKIIEDCLVDRENNIIITNQTYEFVKELKG